MALTDTEKLEYKIAAEVATVLDEHVQSATGSQVSDISACRNVVTVLDSDGNGGYNITVTRFVNPESEPF